MINARSRKLSIIVLCLCCVIWEAGCMGQSIPIFSSSPTPNLSATANPHVVQSATPTIAPTYLTLAPTDTPAPTVTPLVGGGRTITFRDYNQTIILNIGETFVVQKLPEGSSLKNSEFMFLERTSGPEDPTQGDQEYQATASGSGQMDIYIGIPCPNAPMGCQPPLPYSLRVIVLGEVNTTPTPTNLPYPVYQ